MRCLLVCASWISHVMWLLIAFNSSRQKNQNACLGELNCNVWFKKLSYKLLLSKKNVTLQIEQKGVGLILALDKAWKESGRLLWYHKKQ